MEIDMFEMTILNKKYSAATVAACVDIWNKTRDRLDFGASKQCGSDIYHCGVKIARVSYNGRLWDLLDNEIK